MKLCVNIPPESIALPDLYRVICMVEDYLLFTLNYEVALLPKIRVVPQATCNP